MQRIVVYGLPKETTEQALAPELEQFGQIVYLCISREETENWANIYFSADSNAVGAVEYLTQMYVTGLGFCIDMDGMLH